MIEWIRNPEHRFRLAVRVSVATLIAWPSTHALMVLLDPPENSWVFHVLMAISFIAILYTCADVIATTDVRREQD